MHKKEKSVDKEKIFFFFCYCSCDPAH